MESPLPLIMMMLSTIVTRLSAWKVSIPKLAITHTISIAFIKMSIEDAYPAYFDHMACAYATTGDPGSIPEALAGPDAHLWVEALNRETSQHEKNGTFGPPINPNDLP